MISWREEGEKRTIALLGDIEVGRVFASDFDDGFMAYLDLKSCGPFQSYWTSDLLPTLSAAKAALAEAVGGWCARAGLMSAQRPDFGERTVECPIGLDGAPIVLSCRAVAPGLSMHDLVCVFDAASKEAGERDSFSGNPAKWPVTRGVSAVVEKVLAAIYPIPPARS